MEFKPRIKEKYVKKVKLGEAVPPGSKLFKIEKEQIAGTECTGSYEVEYCYYEIEVPVICGEKGPRL